MKCLNPHQRGGRMLRKAGYKRAKGGMVPGEAEQARPDKRARGGAAGKHKGKVTININAGQKGDPQREQMAMQAGVQKGLMIGRSMPHPGGPPAGPPMAPPPGAGMAPPGGPPMAGPPHPPMAAPPGGPPMGPPPGVRPPGMA